MLYGPILNSVSIFLLNFWVGRALELKVKLTNLCYNLKQDKQINKTYLKKLEIK